MKGGGRAGRGREGRVKGAGKDRRGGLDAVRAGRGKAGSVERAECHREPAASVVAAASSRTDLRSLALRSISLNPELPGHTPRPRLHPFTPSPPFLTPLYTRALEKFVDWIALYTPRQDLTRPYTHIHTRTHTPL